MDYSRTFSSGSPHEIHQTASILQSQCQDILNKAEFVLQTDADRARAAAEAEHCMMSARDIIERLTGVAVDLRNMGQPNDNVLMMVDNCTAQLRAVQMALSGSMHRMNQGSMGWDETNITLQNASGWINQQKRLIETSPWAEDPSAIEQQIMNHNRFHNSIQRSVEVERAQAELRERQDKGGLHMLEQEWDSLQRMSFERGAQLQELQNIIAEMSQELMWVNDREEEELIFDWDNKNIDVYIPQKQESYSRLMSDLEEKEKHLTKLKQKVDNLLSNNHPASDKIEAYMDALQTQWSWLLQITKCISVHLKENAAYSQFFTEANELNGKLQQQHDGLRKNFKCDKTTPLTTLQEMLKGIENEQEYMAEHRQRMQQLVSKSRNIVRLEPRKPDEKSSNVKVQALCDFKQDQKVIFKGDIGILKDNSERSKWLVTGPGGLDMEVPSVCLLVPPPNPLCVSLASKNEQCYEALQAVWNKLFINIKRLISWQYFLHDISHIDSLTITMLTKMRPEEYRCIIKSLKTHYQEYQENCLGSEVFDDEDKRAIENQYTGAQKRYFQLIVQLPSYDGQQDVFVDASVNYQYPMSAKVSSGVNVLSELHALLLKLEAVESAVNTHQHIPVGHEAPAECTSLITSTQAVVQNVESLREEFQRLNERTLAETKGMKDTDKAQFLQSQLNMMNQRLDRLGSHFAAYLQRLKALKSLLQLFLEAEVVVKVYEARLAEKVTTSIDPAEVQEYQSTLSLMRSELDQKEGVLHSLEEELTKVGHRSDMDLCLYHEHVKQLSDRWKRILAQINNRFEDLDTYLQQLKHYLNSSSALSAWIRDTKSRIDAQMTTRTDDQAVLNKLLNQQKALNSEITGKRETMDAVQRNGDTCVYTIKNYELDLASYSAGLETLLNIPIKRTMLQSPTTVVIQEVSSLHSLYIELLTRSSNYCKSLGDSLKNLEELKIRNTKIDLLEEELNLLRANVDDCNAKNASMEATLAQYQLKLNESQEHLLSLEEVKRSQALQCSTTKASLNSPQNRLEELMEELSRLKRLVEEEKRNRKIVEERYSSQQEDHEDAMRKRLQELEVANFAKLELEKLVSDRMRDIQALKSQLEEETHNLKQAQMEMAKVRQQHSIEIREINQIHESQILVTQTNTQKLSKQLKDDSSTMQMECERLDGERKKLQEELRRLQITLTEEQAQRRDTEALLQQQITAGTEEARKRSELEAQIQLLLSQQRAEESRWQEVQVTSTKSLQEKNSQISTLKQSLDDELHKKRALEATNSHLQKELADLHAKHTTCNQELIKLRSAQQELSILRVEVETQGNERNRAEQNIAHLQTRAKELQEELKQMDGQLNQQIKVAQEEAAKCRKIEAQLENTSQAMREYISTITTLKKSQEEASMEAKRSEEERKKLQDALDRNLKEQGTSSQRLASLDAELKALRLQLVQEQGRVSEANQRIQTLHRTMEEKTKALNESIAETNRLKKQIAAGTEEARKRSELEAQIQLLLSQQRAEKSRWQEVQVTSTKSLQEKNSQISTLKQSLDDELHKKRALEATIGHLQKELADLHAKHTTCNQELIKLRSAQQELSILRVEVETQGNERNRAEQNIAHLQTRAKELQEELKQMDGQLNQQIKVAQEEAAKCRKIEAQLENKSQAMREYITTITTLKKSQEEASMEAKRSEEERKKLQEALDRYLKEQGTSSQRLASLDAEVKALRLQLVQEQGRVSEANQRTQTLHRTMEEKTKALNESIAETNRLKKQIAAGTEEARKRSELEAQIQLLLSQQRAEKSRWQEVQVTSTKSLQEKNSQISTLKQSLDDELHKKRALEATIGHLQKELADIHAKHTTCNQKLSTAQQELSILRMKVETQGNERNRAEQNIAHLQTRAKELQEELKQMDGQLNQQIKVAQEEAAKCRKIEAQLENKSQAMCEYISTITTLKKSQEEASMEAKRSEEERKKLQEALDRYLKEQGTSSQRLASLDAEVNALRLQLVQEQGRVSEANQRIQTLHRTMEEKTKALNESIAETNRLKKQIAAGTEEARKRSELEAQIQLLLSQQRAEESRWQEVQVTSTKSLQEKNSQISTLKQSLDDELHKKRALEATIGHLQKELADIHAKHTTCNQKLSTAQQELSILRMEVETQGNERNRAEQNIAHLQTRAKELQEELKQMDGQLNQQIKVAQEEAAKCRKIEAQLENKSQAMCEYISTITTLKKSQEEASMEAKRSEEERKKLQEALDRYLKEQGTSSQRLASLDAEVNALRLQLVQEQGRVSEANQRIQTLHRTMKEKTKALNESIAETNRLKKQIAAGTEEARKRSELEAQIQLLLSQQRAEESRWQEVQVTSTKSLQEKNSQISTLKQSLDDELHKKRALEATIGHLQKELADIHANHTTCNQKLSTAQQELSILRMEVETQGNERNRAEQNIAHLQTRAKELQEELKQMDGQLNQQIKVAQEEAAKCRKIEAQLENTSQAMREYISTITTLKKSQEEASMEAKRSEEERKKLQEALDRYLKEQGTSSQRLASLDAEVNALRLQLVQEQGRVSEANQRIQTLHRTMEEKTKALNESIAETNRLKKQIAAGTEEARKRSELEAQIQLLLSQQRAEESRWQEVQVTSTKSLQEKNSQISTLKQSLDDELHKKRALEATIGHLQKELADIHAKHTTCNQKLSTAQQELSILRMEVETQGNERNRAEQNITHFQTRAKELQEELKQMDGQLNQQIKVTQEEAAKCRKIEAQLENKSQAMREYISTITTLKQSQEEASMDAKRSEEERKKLQDALDRNLKEQGTSSQRLPSLDAEVKALRLQLVISTDSAVKLLEAQAATGHILDPRGLIEKGHGICLLEAQIASDGIIDPKQSHRIEVDVAYNKGYFNEEINQILKDEGVDTKGFFDPNTQDNLTYMQLKSRCIKDYKTSLHDRSKISTQKNTTRKTRVFIVDLDTNKEMTVHEAFIKRLTDYEQERELEETASDQKTGLQYDLKELHDKGVINDDNLLKYRFGKITLTQFVDIITSKSTAMNMPFSSSSSSALTIQAQALLQVLRLDPAEAVWIKLIPAPPMPDTVSATVEEKNIPHCVEKYEHVSS